MSGLDHLVLAVAELDRARARYQAMGFTMTPKAQHPFGTGNSNIQLQGCFLEVLTVIAPKDIPEHGPDTFSFAAHNRDFLAKGEGLSMLVLESADARADQHRFAASGLKTYQPFDFSRKATLPSGDEVTVGFSLAFATDPLSPANAFFTCQQHAPEHFWKPDYQRHANTAHTITDVCIVSAAPDAHAAFLEGYTGVVSSAQNGSLVFETGRGRISVVEAARFEDDYQADPPDVSNGARLAGYRIGVDDLGAARAHFQRNNLEYRSWNDCSYIEPQETFGVAVAFEQIAR
ncbi:MAG: VOC family protein [Rhizobiales bacterium]|nr:VOC family protein [Hyphomicrobiales bacterium]